MLHPATFHAGRGRPALLLLLAASLALTFLATLTNAGAPSESTEAKANVRVIPRCKWASRAAEAELEEVRPVILTGSRPVAATERWTGAYMVRHHDASKPLTFRATRSQDLFGNVWKASSIPAASPTNLATRFASKPLGGLVPWQIRRVDGSEEFIDDTRWSVANSTGKILVPADLPDVLDRNDYSSFPPALPNADTTHLLVAPDQTASVLLAAGRGANTPAPFMAAIIELVVMVQAVMDDGLGRLRDEVDSFGIWAQLNKPAITNNLLFSTNYPPGGVVVMFANAGTVKPLQVRTEIQRD